MSASSRLVHDATVALRDAAKAAIALRRVVNAVSKVLKSVADLEARVDALERASIYLRAGEVPADSEKAGLHAIICAETRSYVDTKTAASLLGRAPQTLRKWACYEDGPLNPVRVNGRLAWPVADIERLFSNSKS